MGIAFIIVGGLVLMTVFGAGFDYLKKRKAISGKITEKKVLELEKRIDILESNLYDKDEKIKQLEKEISFVNKLLEKK